MSAIAKGLFITSVIALEMCIFPSPFALACAALYFGLNIASTCVDAWGGEPANRLDDPPLLFCPSFRRTLYIPLANTVCVVQCLHLFSMLEFEWLVSGTCFPVKPGASCTADIPLQPWCVSSDFPQPAFALRAHDPSSLCPPGTGRCMQPGVFVDGLGLLLDGKRAQHVHAVPADKAVCGSGTVGYIFPNRTRHVLLQNLTCPPRRHATRIPTPAAPDAAIIDAATHSGFELTASVDLAADFARLAASRPLLFYVFSPVTPAGLSTAAKVCGALALYITTMACYCQTVRTFADIVMHHTSTEVIYLHLPHFLFWLSYGAFVPLALVCFGVYTQYARLSYAPKLGLVLCSILLWTLIAVLYLSPLIHIPAPAPPASATLQPRGDVLQYAASSLAGISAISTPFLLLRKHE